MTAIHGGGRQVLSAGWDPGKPCQVVLRHDTGNWDLYINARVAYFGTYKGSLLQTNSISHIQFHGESGEVAESSHLSLFNARLYNRGLNSKDMRWLMVGEAGPKYDDGSSYSASASEEGDRGDSSNSESSSQVESGEVSFVPENVSWVLLLLPGLCGPLLILKRRCCCLRRYSVYLHADGFLYIFYCCCWRLYKIFILFSIFIFVRMTLYE
ncbi:trans-sialidase, putative, partial [Trypanosoma cruzi]